MELEHLSSSLKPSLEPDIQTVGDAVGGLDAMGLSFDSRGYFSQSTI